MAQKFLENQTFYTEVKQIQDFLGKYGDILLEKAKESAERHKSILEEYAKETHEWKNRTGRAEETLHTYIDDGTITENPILENGFYIVLSHGAIDPRNNVKYGFYLETMQGGRFAILEKTILAKGNEVFENILNDLGI